MSEIEFTDRYKALGIPYPDPKTMCHGQCEGTGCVPIYRNDTREPWHTLWLECEAKQPTDDGYHFVKCPDCNGTGKAQPAAEEMTEYQFKCLDCGMEYEPRPAIGTHTCRHGELSKPDRQIAIPDDKDQRIRNLEAQRNGMKGLLITAIESAEQEKVFVEQDIRWVRFTVAEAWILEARRLIDRAEGE